MHIEGIQVGPPQFHFQCHFEAKRSRRRVLMLARGGLSLSSAPYRVFWSDGPVLVAERGGLLDPPQFKPSNVGRVSPAGDLIDPAF
jgi:hypothetical protein